MFKVKLETERILVTIKKFIQMWTRQFIFLLLFSPIQELYFKKSIAFSLLSNIFPVFTLFSLFLTSPCLLKIIIDKPLWHLSNNFQMIHRLT
jgi:hypothetical protein